MRGKLWDTGTTAEVPGSVSPELNLGEEAPLSQSIPSSDPPPTGLISLLQVELGQTSHFYPLTITQAHFGLSSLPPPSLPTKVHCQETSIHNLNCTA